MKQLGQPWVHYDGDVMLNSVDDFGWERDQPFDPVNAEHARTRAASAVSFWHKKLDVLQSRALNGIWEILPDDVESFDVALSEYGDPTNIAAHLTVQGRVEASAGSDAAWAHLDEILRHVEHPERTGMLRNELTGLYRVQRTPDGN